MQILSALLSILFVGQAFMPSAKQEKQITTADVAAVVEAKEQGWSFTQGVCTCPVLVRGQESQSVGTWRRSLENGERETILMDIRQIASAEEASEWMRGFDTKALAPKCQINKCPLGDEAYQLECPLNSWDTIKANNFIFFRSGKYLVEVSGGITETVERFARYALAELPASEQSI